jgi:hypothetical protein
MQPNLTPPGASVNRPSAFAMNFARTMVSSGLKRSSQRMQPICRWHQTAAAGDVEVTI